jgi:hypothetical protein
LNARTRCLTPSIILPAPRYRPAMIDDAIDIAFDPPGPDLTYRNYLETCRRAGVTPVTRENADKLIAEWTETIGAALVPPTTHRRRRIDAGLGTGDRLDPAEQISKRSRSTQSRTAGAQDATVAPPNISERAEMA